MARVASGDWIALACGNYNISPNTTGGSVPSPVPTITGSKFSDVANSGTRSVNDPGVPNWPISLYRVSSDFGDQAVGYVTSTTTDQNGNYSFSMNGNGPGTYDIIEGSKQYWHPTTGTTREVTVDPGSGSKTYAVPAFGNHYNLPPVAVIQPVAAMDQTSQSGTQVRLDGSRSYDPDDSIASYTWSGPFRTVTGATPTVTVPPGTSTVQLTVSDGERTDSTSIPVTIYRIISAEAAALDGTEGASTGGTVATFTDPDPGASASEYTATVDWGDGTQVSQDAPIVGTSAGFRVDSSHVYTEEGNYSTTIPITDRDNSFNTARVHAPIAIGDAALKASGGSTASTNPLSNYTVATFSDANSYGSASDLPQR